MLEERGGKRGKVRKHSLLSLTEKLGDQKNPAYGFIRERCGREKELHS